MLGVQDLNLRFVFVSQGSRELDHEVSPRGQGNVVSVEFNLLYRWHAALSKPDTEWTEELFESVFNTKDFKSVSFSRGQMWSLFVTG